MKFKNIFLLILFLLFFYIFLNIKIVKNDSMSPNLRNNYIVLTNPFFSMRTGDIYGFKYNNKIYVKRLIAQPFDIIEIKDGRIFINYLQYRSFYVNKFDRVGPLKLNKDQYFFIGDNELNSFDSRSFGSIDRKDIKFKILFIIYPFNKIGFLR
ncbi:MAG TPA: signal peptidase I [Spirochaetota bacterium]|nr:signal peptidase I [Spirochaetota bacterium]HOL56678.1 signal peptidase I [Spirochaetota bacterium]HPP03314.1 signal peptidase I [Spirochaetota bacterium]